MRITLTKTLAGTPSNPEWGTPITLEEIYNLVSDDERIKKITQAVRTAFRTEDIPTAKRLKNSLPAIMPVATIDKDTQNPDGKTYGEAFLLAEKTKYFYPTLENLQATSMFQLDLDKIDGHKSLKEATPEEVTEKLEEIRTAVNKLESTALSYLSPSGKGFKALIYRMEAFVIPGADNAERILRNATKRVNEAAAAYLLKSFEGTDLFDLIKSCMDLGPIRNSNLRAFLAHDPKVYINPEAEMVDPGDYPDAGQYLAEHFEEFKPVTPISTSKAKRTSKGKAAQPKGNINGIPTVSDNKGLYGLARETGWGQDLPGTPSEEELADYIPEEWTHPDPEILKKNEFVGRRLAPFAGMYIKQEPQFWEVIAAYTAEGVPHLIREVVKHLHPEWVAKKMREGQYSLRDITWGGDYILKKIRAEIDRGHEDNIIKFGSLIERFKNNTDYSTPVGEVYSHIAYVKPISTEIPDIPIDGVLDVDTVKDFGRAYADLQMSLCNNKDFKVTDKEIEIMDKLNKISSFMGRNFIERTLNTSIKQPEGDTVPLLTLIQSGKECKFAKGSLYQIRMNLATAETTISDIVPGLNDTDYGYLIYPHANQYIYKEFMSAYDSRVREVLREEIITNLKEPREEKDITKMIKGLIESKGLNGRNFLQDFVNSLNDLPYCSLTHEKYDTCKSYLPTKIFFKSEKSAEERFYNPLMHKVRSVGLLPADKKRLSWKDVEKRMNLYTRDEFLSEGLNQVKENITLPSTGRTAHIAVALKDERPYLKECLLYILNTIFQGNEELVDHFCKFIALTLFEDRAGYVRPTIIVVGPHGTGKSLLVDLLNMLCARAAAPLPENKEYFIPQAQLYLVEETDGFADKRIDLFGRIKELTRSMSPMSSREIYSKVGKILPNCSLFMAGNTMPVYSGDVEGLSNVSGFTLYRQLTQNLFKVPGGNNRNGNEELLKLEWVQSLIKEVPDFFTRYEGDLGFYLKANPNFVKTGVLEFLYEEHYRKNDSVDRCGVDPYHKDELFNSQTGSIVEDQNEEFLSMLKKYIKLAVLAFDPQHASDIVKGEQNAEYNDHAYETFKSTLEEDPAVKRFIDFCKGIIDPLNRHPLVVGMLMNQRTDMMDRLRWDVFDMERMYSQMVFSWSKNFKAKHRMRIPRLLMEAILLETKGSSVKTRFNNANTSAYKGKTAKAFLRDYYRDILKIVDANLINKLSSPDQHPKLADEDLLIDNKPHHRRFDRSYNPTTNPKSYMLPPGLVNEVYEEILLEKNSPEEDYSDEAF